jgi:hypothetical protein
MFRRTNYKFFLQKLRVSYKRQELLTIHNNLSSSLGFCGGPCCSTSVLHIFETNLWHLWKPRYGLPLLRRWYIVVEPRDNLSDMPMKLTSCLSDIREWMCSNLLKLNQDKTICNTEVEQHGPPQKPRDELRLLWMVSSSCLL